MFVLESLTRYNYGGIKLINGPNGRKNLADLRDLVYGPPEKIYGPLRNSQTQVKNSCVRQITLGSLFLTLADFVCWQTKCDSTSC